MLLVFASNIFPNIFSNSTKESKENIDNILQVLMQLLLAGEPKFMFYVRSVKWRKKS